MVAVLHSAAVAVGVVQVPLVFLYLSAEEGEGREKEEKKVSFCQFCCLKRYNDNTNVPLRSGGWCRQSEQQQDEGGTEKSEHFNFWTRERERARERNSRNLKLKLVFSSLVCGVAKPNFADWQ